jgi:hypothetical protein
MSQEERSLFEEKLIAEIENSVSSAPSDASDDDGNEDDVRSGLSDDGGEEEDAATNSRARERQLQRQVDLLMSGYSAWQTLNPSSSKMETSTAVATSQFNRHIDDAEMMEYELLMDYTSSD